MALRRQATHGHSLPPTREHSSEERGETGSLRSARTPTNIKTSKIPQKPTAPIFNQVQVMLKISSPYIPDPLSLKHNAQQLLCKSGFPSDQRQSPTSHNIAITEKLQICYQANLICRPKEGEIMRGSEHAMFASCLLQDVRMPYIMNPFWQYWLTVLCS